jgi:hypothetical protein
MVEEADPGDIGAKRTVMAADYPAHPEDFITPSVQERPFFIAIASRFRHRLREAASEQETEAEKKVPSRLLTV